MNNKNLKNFSLSWLMCIIAAFFYFYEYLLRVSPSIMADQLMHFYHIKAASLGNLIACYYYIYSPMQIPVGILIDRYSTRNILFVSCLLCSLGNYFFSCSHYLIIAAIGRFLIGFGSAFSFVGVLKIANIWLPDNKFGLVSGFTTALGTIGGIVGQIGLTEILKIKGWQNTLYILSYIGLFISFIIIFFIKDKKSNLSSRKESWRNFFLKILIIIKNYKIWINGIIGGLIYLSTSVFTEFWGISYLKSIYHYSPRISAECISTIFIGWTIGGIFIGYISDKIYNKLLLIFTGSLISAMLISIIFYTHIINTAIVFIICFLFGMFSSVQSLVFVLGKEIIKDKNIFATLLSFTNMLVMLSGIIFQPLVGILLDFLWDHKTINNIPVYSSANYKLSLSIIPIALILSSILCIILNKNISNNKIYINIQNDKKV